MTIGAHVVDAWPSSNEYRPHVDIGWEKPSGALSGRSSRHRLQTSPTANVLLLVVLAGLIGLATIAVAA